MIRIYAICPMKSIPAENFIFWKNSEGGPFAHFPSNIGLSEWNIRQVLLFLRAMFYSRGIIRRLSGILLCLVFLFGAGVESFHEHPSTSLLTEQCEECSLGHHSGHLSSFDGGIHDCLICRIAAVPFIGTCGPCETELSSAFVGVPIVGQESVPAVFPFSFSSRAPPVSFLSEE